MISSQVLDQVTLVDEKDQVIAAADKLEAHQGLGKLHRAISVYLFRKTTSGIQILIQQRSQKKIVGSLEWANTVCGNVWPDENYLSCANRRLQVELGITKVELEAVEKFRYQIQCNSQFSENEIDQIFAGWYDGEVKPNPDEVKSFVWVDWQRLCDCFAKGVKQEYGQVEINLAINGRETNITLAPWLVVMLNNRQVIDKLEIFLINKNY